MSTTAYYALRWLFFSVWLYGECHVRMLWMIFCEAVRSARAHPSDTDTKLVSHDTAWFRLPWQRFLLPVYEQAGNLSQGYRPPPPPAYSSVFLSLCTFIYIMLHRVNVMFFMSIKIFCIVSWFLWLLSTSSTSSH